jgi:hypothetical protein
MLMISLPLSHTHTVAGRPPTRIDTHPRTHARFQVLQYKNAKQHGYRYGYQIRYVLDTRIHNFLENINTGILI